MNRPTKRLPNGITLFVQEIKEDEDSAEIDISVTLPSNKRGGVRCLVNESSEFVDAIESDRQYYVDGLYRHDNTVLPLVNGCLGVMATFPGKLDQRKINKAFERVEKIAKSARLEKD